MKPEDLEIQRNRNLVKATIQPMPERALVGKGRTRMDHAESAAQLRSVTNDPATNPAGAGHFEGAYAPFKDYSHHYTYAKPDARHAARQRANKARAKSWQTKAQGK